MRATTEDAPPDELPLALWTEGAQGPVIHAMNRAAAQTGVRMGGRLADMRAICPALLAEPADPAGDAMAVARLALWARRFCPWTDADETGPWSGAGLVMDTTGTDHLWGGEPAMLEAIESALSHLGHAADLAVAPTRGAAWGLARFGGVRVIARDPAALNPLPVQALRLRAETVLLLRRLGLKTVGDLAAIPRLSLSRRFRRTPPDDNPLIRLDQATGRLAEPISPPEPPPAFRALARLAEPVLNPAPHLPDLCAALCRDLTAAGQGARLLRLTVWRVDGELRWIEAGCAQASRDPAHLAFLFRERLERIDSGFGFELIELAAPRTQPMDALQTDLGGGAETGPSLPQLLDRLAARFGSDAVTRPQRVARHLPERAVTLVPPLETQASTRPTKPRSGREEPADPATVRPARPLRIFEPAQELQVLYAIPEGPPVQFQWHRHVLRVTRWQGPERIAPEWWADSPGTRLRDYFRIEDQTGRRLWLYREGLAGDGRGGAPRWFVHGMFA